MLCEQVAERRYSKLANVLYLVESRLDLSQQQTNKEVILDEIFRQRVVVLQICTATQQ